LVASGGEDGTVRLWDPVKSAPVGQPLTGDQGSIESLAAVPMPNRNTLIASAGQHGIVRLWDPDAPTRLTCIG
jgi:WD40 repeat protein